MRGRRTTSGTSVTEGQPDITTSTAASMTHIRWATTVGSALANLGTAGSVGSGSSKQRGCAGSGPKRHRGSGLILAAQHSGNGYGSRDSSASMSLGKIGGRMEEEEEEIGEVTVPAAESCAEGGVEVAAKAPEASEGVVDVVPEHPNVRPPGIQGDPDHTRRGGLDLDLNFVNGDECPGSGSGSGSMNLDLQTFSLMPQSRRRPSVGGHGVGGALSPCSSQHASAHASVCGPLGVMEALGGRSTMLELLQDTWTLAPASTQGALVVHR